MRSQMDELRKGIHMVISTPGRLSDMLDKRKFNLDLCRLFVLDEADRLLDLGFEEELKNVMGFFSAPKQMLLFSSTMPKKIQEFTKTALQRPVVVNVGRAGAASRNVK